MTSARRSVLPVVLFAAAVFARPIAAADSSRPILTVAASVKAGAAGSGTLRIDATLASGWHANSHKPSEDYLIPTSVRLEPAEGVKFGDPVYPEGVLRKFAFSETPLSVYEERFTIDVPVSWMGAAAPALSGSVEYQACNDKQCNPPASAAFKTSGGPGAGSGAGAAAATGLPGGAVSLTEAPKTPPSGAASTGGPADFGRILERRGLLGALLIVFGWGLLLNLTPCVYPVIPLTVSFFGGQALGRPGRAFGLAALYVLGMATMYAGLGVAAALSGRLFGSALQSVWVLGGVAAVLVLLALSMFGFFEIRMPTSWMQKAGARAGAAGAYGMGLLVGVVAAPCIGPVVIALLAFVAARQDPAFGLLVFFVLSLGLGLPYLFLGAFSGSLGKLPRAGEWMEQIKKIFGWVLLAMAAWFLRTVVPEPFGKWLLPAVLAVGAAALILSGGAGLGRRVRLAAAVLMIAAAAFFLPRRLPATEALGWKAYESSAVAQSGRSAVVDFSATWCIPCLELDQKTFSDPRVRESLSRRDLWKADMTRTAEPAVVALAEKHRILGVPTVIFLDASGKEREELRLVGFEGPDEFLRRLEQAP